MSVVEREVIVLHIEVVAEVVAKVVVEVDITVASIRFKLAIKLIYI